MMGTLVGGVAGGEIESILVIAIVGGDRNRRGLVGRRARLGGPLVLACLVEVALDHCKGVWRVFGW
jgi:hypothetical protein